MLVASAHWWRNRPDHICRLFETEIASEYLNLILKHVVRYGVPLTFYYNLHSIFTPTSKIDWEGKKNCEDRVHSCSYLARQKGLLTIKNPSASPIKDSGVWAKHNDFWDAYRRRRTRPTHWETKLSLQYRLWKSTPLLETHIASVLIEKLLYSRINLSGKRQKICHQK